MIADRVELGSMGMDEEDRGEGRNRQQKEWGDEEE